MRNATIETLALLVFGTASLLLTNSTSADEWPLAAGDCREVTGIDLMDGGEYQYAEWLATEWKKDAEFARSKGWIKDYMIFANIHARGDEPDLYLIRVMQSLPSGGEFEERAQEYLEWQSKSIEKLVGESGNRAEYREAQSDVLQQRLMFRD